MCGDKGDLQFASDCHQRALEIQLEQLGPNHIKVAASYNNLGNVCADKGDLQLARDYYQRVLEINNGILFSYYLMFNKRFCNFL